MDILFWDRGSISHPNQTSSFFSFSLRTPHSLPLCDRNKLWWGVTVCACVLRVGEYSDMEQEEEKFLEVKEATTTVIDIIFILTTVIDIGLVNKI